jgi:citrate synthase
VAAVPTLVAAFARVREGKEILDPRDDLDHAANFYYLMFGVEPTPAVRKVLDAALILHAEHSMNASTFTARVTGSSLANPYAVVSSAVGTLSGPLHGGANEEALEQFSSIGGGADKVKPWLDAKLAADPKFKIMGMGHRVYKVKDPRATVIQELAEHVFAESTRPVIYDAALELEKLAVPIYGAKGVYPNVDFYSGGGVPVVGHPDGPVHADLRCRPGGRVAGPLVGAVAGQPHLPAGAGVRRQERRGLRPAGEAGVARTRPGVGASVGRSRTRRGRPRADAP